MTDTEIDWNEVRLALRNSFLREADNVARKFRDGQWEGSDTAAVKSMALEMSDAAWDIGVRALDRGLAASKLLEKHARDAVHRTLVDRRVH